MLRSWQRGFGWAYAAAYQARLYLDMDEFTEWAAAKTMQNDITNNVVSMSS